MGQQLEISSVVYLSVKTSSFFRQELSSSSSSSIEGSKQVTTDIG